MSKKIHSQDSNSDPRNHDDYDTWEYGTEPIPNDHTWSDSKELKSKSEAKKCDDFMFENRDFFDVK